MNTIWLKIAGIAVVAVIVIIVVGQLTGGDSSPAPARSDAPGTRDKPKTVYDAFDRDDKEFRVEPQADEPAVAAPAPAPAETPQQPAAQTPPAAPKQPTFEKLSIEDEVQAQRLHEMALAERKRSRLPMMTPKLMVDYCREIIRRWPKSQYAFQAKRMLADIPERYKKMYNVTEQEMDLSSFYQ
jgi:hypothetical protein